MNLLQRLMVWRVLLRPWAYAVSVCGIVFARADTGTSYEQTSD